MGQMTHQQRQTAQAVIWVSRTVPPMRAVWGPRQQFPGDAAAHAFIEGLPAIQDCVSVYFIGVCYTYILYIIWFTVLYFVQYHMIYYLLNIFQYNIIYHVFHLV